MTLLFCEDILASDISEETADGNFFSSIRVNAEFPYNHCLYYCSSLGN